MSERSITTQYIDLLIDLSADFEFHHRVHNLHRGAKELALNPKLAKQLIAQLKDGKPDESTLQYILMLQPNFDDPDSLAFTARLNYADLVVQLAKLYREIFLQCEVLRLNTQNLNAICRIIAEARQSDELKSALNVPSEAYLEGLSTKYKSRSLYISNTLKEANDITCAISVEIDKLLDTAWRRDATEHKRKRKFGILEMHSPAEEECKFSDELLRATEICGGYTSSNLLVSSEYLRLYNFTIPLDEQIGINADTDDLARLWKAVSALAANKS